jgi:CelD/BcsL family acetyltransferase involved in cellulose biosynthesis
MRVQVARSVAEIDRLRPAWEFLYRQADATLFQSFAWNRLAALRFAGREQPYVVLAESDSSLALIPAVITDDRLSLLGEALFDYRDVLFAGSDDALGAAWQRLGELCLPLAVTALRGEIARRRWDALGPRRFVTAPQVPLKEITADAFSSAHSRVGRTLRRLADEGAALLQYDGNASGVITWIYRQKAAQFLGKPDNLFADYTRVEFIAAACQIDPAACDIFAYQANGRLVAALLTFRDRRVRRFYTIWFDPAWAKLSPGTALIYEITRRSLAAGLDCDYMTGEQPHKMRFATSLVPLFRIDAPAGALTQPNMEMRSAA